MIYEMRVYRCLPGRLPALLKRFDTMTLKIWEKHGIKPAGFFTTLIGESNQELTYFLAWESLADREKKWTAFQSDPDWIAARAKTEEDGQIVGNIVSQLLVPTAFSSVKWPAFSKAKGLCRIASRSRPHRARRPRSRRGGGILSPRRFHRRRAQPPCMGHAQPHRAAEELLHRNPRSRRAGENRTARRALVFIRRLSSRLSRQA